MRDLQARGKRKRFFKSNIFAVILAIISLFILRSTWAVYKKKETARINKETFSKSLSVLEAKKKTLDLEIKRLGTDRGLEEELRKRFQVTRPGEQVLIIVDKGEETKPPVIAEQTILQKILNELLALLDLK